MWYLSYYRQVLPVLAALLSLIPIQADDGLEPGYFDGRLWRINSGTLAQTQVAVGDENHLFMSGMQLGAVAGSAFPNLARWDGRRWESLSNDRTFTHLLAVERQLIVAGRFSRVGGISATNIARWDNGTWYPLGPGLQGNVQALAEENGRLYVGGSLTAVGSPTLSNIVRWDFASGQWDSVGEGLPAPVRLLESTPQGLFAVWPGEGVDNLSRWNGNSWETVAAVHGSNSLDAPVSDLVWHDDSLVITGSFDQIDGESLGLMARLRQGNWEQVGSPKLTGQPRSLAVAGGDLFVSGSVLLEEGGTVIAGGVVARLQGTRWEISLGAGASAERLIARGEEIFAVGKWTERPPLGSGNYLVVWQFDGHAWSPLNGGIGEVTRTRRLTRHHDGVVVRLESPSTPLLYDGQRFRHTTNSSAFTFVNTEALGSDGHAAHALAAVSGVASNFVVVRLEGLEWKPAAEPSPIKASVLAFGGGRLFVAGFSSPREPTDTVVMAWDGTRWSQLGGSFRNTEIPFASAPLIASLQWLGGSLYAGGSFTTIADVPNTNLARWSGQSWEQVGDFNGPVTGLAAAARELHVVGRFNRVGPLEATNYARWNGQDWTTLGSGLPGMIPDTVAVSDDSQVVVSGTGVRLLFWRGDHWQSPETGDRSDSGPLRNATWVGNDLYLAPEYPVVGPVESLGLACWHERGARILPRVDGDAPSLRVTGATTSRFALERSTDLKTWNPFATNALGNPGQYFRDPATPAPETYYRVREIE